jgi:ribonuclease R
MLQSMMLRSMQQAVYSPDNVGHFGLAYEAYAHFTSPIRRYPDLLTHRALRAILAGRKYQPEIPSEVSLQTALSSSARALQRAAEEDGRSRGAGTAVWEELGMHCSANERRADEASRDVEAWLKCYFMRDKLGEEYGGMVSGVTSFGIFVQLDTLFIEGLVHVTELGSDYFQYDEVKNELRGERTGIRYRLSDRVRVQVSRVDLDARKIDFRLVRDAPVKAPSGPRGADRGGADKGGTDKGGESPYAGRGPKASAPGESAPASGPAGRGGGRDAVAKKRPTRSSAGNAAAGNSRTRKKH